MDKLDLLAEVLHNGWWKFQLDHGLRLGPDKIDERTVPAAPKAEWMHPHLVNWSGKCTTDKNQDRYEAALILHSWFNENVTEECLAEKIHESWREWLRVVGSKNHPHNHPYKDAGAHATDPREHSIQAKRVLEFLKENFPKE